MKKLSIAVAILSLSIAAPVFACPESNKEAPRTAEKAKETPAETAKSTDKAKEAKPADKAKPAKDAKPADKVSQR
jgi:hypothetical protein